MSKILLVEDDEALALGIEFTLKDEGYDVTHAENYTNAKQKFDSENYDLILLDVTLPDGNGYDLCKYIRSKNEVPVIFLTALDEEVNVVLGLEIGGDDYITKPFRVKELTSRIKAILRRNNKSGYKDSTIKSGNITINTSMAAVMKNDKEIVLTAQEYKLLLLFITSPQKVLKREDILDKLIEGEAFFDENTLSVYIKRVRGKIEDNPKEPEYIVTMRGLGYKWNKDIIK